MSGSYLTVPRLPVGGVVAYRVWRWTCDQEFAGWNLGQGAAVQRL